MLESGRKANRQRNWKNELSVTKTRMNQYETMNLEVRSCGRRSPTSANSCGGIDTGGVLSLEKGRDLA